MTQTSTSRRNLTTARRELAEAIAGSKPLDHVTRAALVASIGEARVAALEVECSALEDTIPALEAEVAHLEATACPRCTGTGDYQAPTHHLSKGRPVCFACNGTGVRTR